MRALAIAFTLLAGNIARAQDSLKYWVQFTDKNSNGFSIAQPESYLSARALERRSKQGIAIDEKDLPLTEIYVDSMASLGATILNRSKWFNAVSFSTNDTQLILQVQSLGFVNDTEAVKRLRGNITDKFEACSPQPNLRTFQDYGQALTQIKMLNGDVVHDIGYSGRGVMIAVIDAGFSEVETSRFFDVLWDEGRIIATRDFVDGDDLVFDHSQHGAAVLSTIAAYTPGEMIGTGYNAEFLLLRSEEGGSEFLIEEDNWVAAAEFADSMGADILSTSLGYTNFDDSLMDHTYADMDGNTTRITIGGDIAASRGMLVINSAGNEGASPWHYIGAPADGDSVLAVGSVDANRNYSPFSSTGPSFDGRVKPDVAAMGQGVTVAIGPSLLTSSGTSFAGPIIAGMAACLWEAHPEKTNMEIYNAIIGSAHQINVPDSLLGYGIPNFVNALYSLEGPPVPTPPASAYAIPTLVHDYFTLYFASDSDFEGSITAFDALGRAIFDSPFSFRHRTNYAVPFDGSGLPPGAYFVRINKTDRETVRILKGL
jgi:subtilisin family serine protease